MRADDETDTSEGTPTPTAYPGSGPQESRATAKRRITDVTARVETIVDAAENVAREIRAEAEADALIYARTKREEVDRMVASRQKELADLRGSLIMQAEAVQREIGLLASQIEALMSETIQARAEQGAESVAAPIPPIEASETTSGLEREEPGGPRPPGRPSEAHDNPVAPGASTESTGPPLAPSASPEGDSTPPDGELGASEPRSRFTVPFLRSKPSEQPEVADEEASESDDLTQAIADDSAPPIAAPTHERRGDPDAAMLMATQMAVAGSSRAEVRTALLREFEPADAENAILEVLGPGNS